MRRLRQARISNAMMVQFLRHAGVTMPEDVELVFVHIATDDCLHGCAHYVFESAEFAETPELAEPIPWTLE